MSGGSGERAPSARNGSPLSPPLERSLSLGGGSYEYDVIGKVWTLGGGAEAGAWALIITAKTARLKRL